MLIVGSAFGFEQAAGGFAGGVCPAFVAMAILFFAFTSIIGNDSYAENAMEFLGLGGRNPLLLLKAGAVAMVVWGSLQAVGTVFNFADASMALMATVNLVAILMLSGTVSKLTRDYFAQRKRGEEAVFHVANYPEISDGVDHTIWDRDAVSTRQAN